MKRLLAYWPAAALLLALAGLVAQPYVARRVNLGRPRPPILHFPPTLDDIPGGGADSAFSGAPPPRFTSLTWSDGAGTTTVDSLVATRGWRSIVRTRVDVGPDLGWEDWSGAVPGLWPVVSARRMREQAEPVAMTRHTIDDVRGQLFPLAVGNHLSFRARTELQYMGRWRDHGRRYFDLRVTGLTTAYANANPAVPGPVFVIESRSDRNDRSDVDGEPIVLHFAQALGTVISRYGPEGQAERLVEWH
jgi:hypothetical protein